MHFARFEFQNKYGHNRGWCDVKTAELSDGKRMVIVTEPIAYNGDYLNEGWSVTNGIEYIAERLYNELNQTWDFLVEYVPMRGTSRQAHLRSLELRRKLYVDPMFDHQIAMETFKVMGQHTYFHQPEWEHISHEAFQNRFGFALQWHKDQIR